jgi:hypothetical protein
MSPRHGPRPSLLGRLGPRDTAPPTPAVGSLEPLLLVLIVSLVIGCEVVEPDPPKPQGPMLYPVRGRVTVDGKPLAKAIVAFLPEFSDGGTHSVAETKGDGTYELAYMGRPGVGRGGYRVVISYIVGPDGTVADLKAHSPVDTAMAPELNKGKELLPPRYSDFSKTELGATVLPAGPFTFDFNLEGPLLEPPVPASRGDPSPAKVAPSPPASAQ